MTATLFWPLVPIVAAGWLAGMVLVIGLLRAAKAGDAMADDALRRRYDDAARQPAPDWQLDEADVPAFKFDARA
jgi:hypothetical protein